MTSQPSTWCHNTWSSTVNSIDSTVLTSPTTIEFNPDDPSTWTSTAVQQLRSLTTAATSTCQSLPTFTISSLPVTLLINAIESSGESTIWSILSWGIATADLPVHSHYPPYFAASMQSNSFQHLRTLPPAQTPAPLLRACQQPLPPPVPACLLQQDLARYVSMLRHIMHQCVASLCRVLRAQCRFLPFSSICCAAIRVEWRA